jgi:DNA-binding beta-propeller fold protein YncE
MNRFSRIAGVLATAVALTGCAAAAGTGASAPGGRLAAPDRDYLVLVAAEAIDEVSLVRFGPAGARVERRHDIGLNRADPDGPHGVAVSPDGRHYYVTTGHGTPNGYLWKYSTADHSVVGRVELGLFPASLQVSPDGLYAYVVNFNLHGDMVPSAVSVVSTGEMVEIARLTTCTMPHGSRTNPQGTRHYSTCMMDEMLVEIDTRQLQVARHFMLSRGQEHGMSGAPRSHAGRQHAGGDHSGHGSSAPAAGSTKCSPTWAESSADGSRVYVACNASNDIVEVDVASWSLLRRIPAGDGVYNLAPTGDGRLLVATNKRGQSVHVIDLASGNSLARIPTTRRIVHGVAISDDNRYAFISVEGFGAEPGTVEIIDLRALRRVASVDVGQMAGGIDFWKSEPVR